MKVRDCRAAASLDPVIFGSASVTPIATALLCRALQIQDDAAYERDGRHVQPDVLVKTMLEVILNTYAASSHSGGLELSGS